MVSEFDNILDKCIDRLSRGESLKKCLADYPEHKAQLEPLLRVMTETATAYSFVPSSEAKRNARLRFYSELERRRQPSFWQKMTLPRLAWVSATSAILLLVIGLFVLRPALWPGVPELPPAVSELPPDEAVPEYPSDESLFSDLSIITIPSASADGNFIFMVSDDVNAIEDFSAVNVIIDKVWLLKSGEPEQWVEFTPSTQEFNLALLPGDTTQELWRGNIPVGEYSRVVIQVSQVTGTLKATGETIEIKLPSNKLQIKSPFVVSADSVTSFTYDLTVVNAGNAQDGNKYLLKPQASESGSNQTPDTSKPTPPGKEKEQKVPKK